LIITQPNIRDSSVFDTMIGSFFPNCFEFFLRVSPHKIAFGYYHV